jgi:F-type H+-transporting ATPase subunit c
MLRKAVVIFLLAGALSLAFVSLGLAQEEVEAELSDSVKMSLALASGFGFAIVAFWGAISQGRAITAAMEGIARNPGAREQMFIPLVLGLVFIESLVIYGLVLALILQGKI